MTVYVDDPAEHCARLDIASNDPARVEIGTRRLRQIEHTRAQRQIEAIEP